MNADTSDIHRLLDEAFAGVTMTPDVQDLKEELRGSLAARSAELQARGADPRAAAATAVEELGDIRGLIASVGEAEGQPAPDLRLAAFEIARQERVRPKPAFVIRAALCGVVIALSAVVVVLAALGIAGATAAMGIGFAVVVGVAIALVAADALRQETTVHHRMPSGRAWGYGLAGGALGAGLGLAGLFAGHLDLIALLVAGVVLVVAGGAALIALGVTQTNRTKPWALAQARQWEEHDRFSEDPAAAARFGIYTVVIWIVAIAAFVVLSITVGFAWSWLALVGGLAVFFLVLSRMLFTSDK
jgi:hypothetical protein